MPRTHLPYPPELRHQMVELARSGRAIRELARELELTGHYRNHLLGHDIFNGGDGNDILEGATGHDRLTGGNGADTFEYRGAYGTNTITDFGAGDRILFQGGGGFASLVIVQDGADAVIDGGFYSIRLSGMSADSLSKNGLIFTPRVYLENRNFFNNGDRSGTLSGDEGTDFLEGYGGDDALHGGTGTTISTAIPATTRWWAAREPTIWTI